MVSSAPEELFGCAVLRVCNLSENVHNKISPFLNNIFILIIHNFRKKKVKRLVKRNN